MYVLLGKYDNLPIIIVVDINGRQVKCLVSMLKRFTQAIGWTIADIIGIPPSICSQNIQLNPYYNTSIKH